MKNIWRRSLIAIALIASGLSLSAQDAILDALPDGQKIIIKAFNGHYVRESSGAVRAPDDQLTSEGQFTVVRSDTKIGLQIEKNKEKYFVVAEANGDVWSTGEDKTEEKAQFVLEGGTIEGGMLKGVAFRTSDGHYLSTRDIDANRVMARKSTGELVTSIGEREKFDLVLPAGTAPTEGPERIPGLEAVAAPVEVLEVLPKDAAEEGYPKAHFFSIALTNLHAFIFAPITKVVAHLLNSINPLSFDGAVNSISGAPPPYPSADKLSFTSAIKLICTGKVNPPFPEHLKPSVQFQFSMLSCNARIKEKAGENFI